MGLGKAGMGLGMTQSGQFGSAGKPKEEEETWLLFQILEIGITWESS